MLLTGTKSKNTLTGGVENDTLDGGAGADLLIGGAGNDLYVVDNVGDKVTELADEGQDTIHSSVSFSLMDTDGKGLNGGNVEHLTLTGSKAINATGNALNNTLTGNSAVNVLDGKAGLDTMDGGAGNDIYLINSPDDHTQAEIADSDGLADEIRFTSTIAGSSLTLFANDLGIERVVIGTGAGKTAVSTAKIALNLDASALLNGVALIGNAGANFLTGSQHNDTLNGGAGADAMQGGQGDDTYHVDNASDLLNEQSDAGEDTVISSLKSYTLLSNFEHLTLAGAAISGTGTSLANQMTGNALANTLTGLNGSDTLNGGAGADLLIGGADGDTYIIDNAGDKISETADGGIDTVMSAVSYSLVDTDAKGANGGNVEHLTLTGSKAINATGNALNNTLTGNSAVNVLDGKAGLDTMDGGAGNDIYLIGLAADHAAAEIQDSDATPGAIDEVRFASTLANDTLTIYAGDTGIERVVIGTGSAKAAVSTGKTSLHVDASAAVNSLTIIGNAGANSIIGTAQNDTINGGAGNDTLAGGAGQNSLLGGAGNDVFVLTNISDVVVEVLNAGTDTIQIAQTYSLLDTDGAGANGGNVENLVLTGAANISGTGNKLNNQITGNAGDNTLTGAEGNDTLDAGAGADILDGGIGNDMLTGGLGDDTMDGGAGVADTAVFSGSADDYDISLDSGVFVVSGADGVDVLTNIELVKFGDAAAVSLAGLAGGTGISLDAAIATLDSGAIWSSMNLNYSFMTQVPSYDTAHSGFRVMTAEEQQAVRDVLQLYANIAGFTFTEVTDSNLSSVQLRFGAETQQPGLAGYAYFPNSGPFLSGDVWMNKELLAIEGVEPGGVAYSTLIHEIGHALGLKHPGNYDLLGDGDVAPFLPASLDNNLYTVMSYSSIPKSTVFRINDDGTFGGFTVVDGQEVSNLLNVDPVGPMLFDIATIQDMYGSVNSSFMSGNSSYVYNEKTAFFEALWDGGGVDTIDTSSFTRNSKIDLREGHFSSIGYADFLIARGQTGFELEVISEEELNLYGASFINSFYKPNSYNGENNLAIAYGVVIENAIGGAGDDHLRGNNVANQLTGGAGDDSIAGAFGDDTLVGGAGNDTLIGGIGEDVFVFNSILSAAANLDILTDFVSASDIFQLDDSIFSQLGGAGQLATGLFNSGEFSAAQDVDDRIIFNTSNGALLYDADGTGGMAAVQFAVLTTTADLAATDFFVV